MAKIKQEYTQEIENFGKLGRRVEIGSTAKVDICKAGRTIKYFVPTVEVLIGIGNNHTARFIMDELAWKALKRGDEINIDSLVTFKKKFL